MDIKLSCQCGNVQGQLVGINPNAGNHVMCMCDDCQTFSNYLGKQESLEKHYGGTDIFQLTPNKIQITEGNEFVKAIRLSPRGLHRFYASCCNTPLANTMGHDKAFAGIFTDSLQLNEEEKKQTLGPVTLYWKTEFARPGLPEDSYQPRKAIRPILRILKMFTFGKLFKWNSPNPFFDLATGKAKGEVTVLTKEQRTKLTPIPNENA